MLTVEKSTFGPVISVVCFDGWKFNNRDFYVSTEMYNDIIEAVYVGECNNNVIISEITFEKSAGTIGWSFIADFECSDNIEADSGDPAEYVQQNGLEVSEGGKALLSVYKQMFDELYKSKVEDEHVAVVAAIKEFMTA